MGDISPSFNGITVEYPLPAWTTGLMTWVDGAGPNATLQTFYEPGIAPGEYWDAISIPIANTDVYQRTVPSRTGANGQPYGNWRTKLIVSLYSNTLSSGKVSIPTRFVENYNHNEVNTMDFRFEVKTESRMGMREGRFSESDVKPELSQWAAPTYINACVMVRYKYKKVGTIRIDAPHAIEIKSVVGSSSGTKYAINIELSDISKPTNAEMRLTRKSVSGSKLSIELGGTILYDTNMPQRIVLNPGTNSGELNVYPTYLLPGTGTDSYLWSVQII